MRRLIIRFAGVSSLIVALGVARSEPAAYPRPRISGVAQVALYVHDMTAAREFYGSFLGFAEPFSLTNPDGSLRAALFKIGDRQSVELVPEAAPATERLVHISLETDNAEGMRLYLKSRGIAVPDQVTKGKVTAFYFAVKDPDGHTVEFMQFLPDSWTSRDFGLHLPPTRISEHMSHAGVVVRHLDAALAFYRDVLGCTEIWRGSGNGRQLSWVNLRVPDGADWVEFMLYDKTPNLSRLGTDHHFCLLVADAAAAGETLNRRPLPAGAVLAARVRVGTDHKRQIHAYDPDGTRVEIMEPRTVDGRPAPSSDAQPPG